MYAVDWKNPDYLPIWQERARRLAKLRADPLLLQRVRAYYRDHIADFINDWGVTVDPRNVERGIPALMPMMIFPKQREFIDWVISRWRGSESGLCEKSRDVGATWLAAGISVGLCVFWDNVGIGFGSRKEELVDKIGDPKCIFHKIRTFVRYLPREFRGGCNLDKHAPHMRCIFPERDSHIAGEAGMDIGRGDRKSIYFVDEAAHLEHPEAADAALSATTNCRIDMSSVNTMNNPFAHKRHSGRIKVFTFSWRDDPRKDQAWYDKKCSELDPITVAQEIDLNYHAAAEGIIIPQQWVQAAIDAHVKLNIDVSGARFGSMDVADRGKDKNSFVVRHGILVEHAESWSGQNSDIYHSVEKAFGLCDRFGLSDFLYDEDGLGAGVRGDARKVNEARQLEKMRFIGAHPFRGSAAVHEPEQFVPRTDRKNKDMFQNRKAQGWYALHERFRNTFRAIRGEDYDPDSIISLSSNIPELTRLTVELSQPVWKTSQTGKMMVDKTPDEALSPNLADGVYIAFAPRRTAMVIDPSLLDGTDPID
jgi:hypothetical protein